MKKIKESFKKILGERNTKRISTVKFKLTTALYSEIASLNIFFKLIKCHFDKKYIKNISDSISILDKYKNKKYIIFHNPNFLGVTSATKELFDNTVPMIDLYRKKDIRKISKKICDNNIKEVYFSAFCYGWSRLIKEIKKDKPSIKIKTFWHGSHSQILDTFGWKRNQEIINLHTSSYVDLMATCKASLLGFYKKNDYNACFLNNTVTFNGEKYYDTEKHDKKRVKLGLYSANTEWRKNMMNQIAAAKLIQNAVIDMVPIKKEAALFANSLGVVFEGLPKPIPREEILARMAKNDVNLYVTFSECAPMLPIESLEVGVPCISGNNHHFFKGTELEKYLIVNNETDIYEIKEKIELCMKYKKKILELYKSWKKENDKFTKDTAIAYMNGGDINE